MNNKARHFINPYIHALSSIYCDGNGKGAVSNGIITLGFNAPDTLKGWYGVKGQYIPNGVLYRYPPIELIKPEGAKLKNVNMHEAIRAYTRIEGKGVIIISGMKFDYAHVHIAMWRLQGLMDVCELYESALYAESDEYRVRIEAIA